MFDPVIDYGDRLMFGFKDALKDDSGITAHMDGYITLHCTGDALVLTREMSVELANKLLELAK